MVISHRYQFIYFAPTKTATSSVASVLEENFEAEEYAAVEVNDSDKVRHSMRFPKELEHYTTFATVRNPFTRCLSLYNFFGRGCSIQKFAEERKYRSICEQLWPELVWDNESIPEGCIPVRLDHVVKVESIHEDFHKLPFVEREIELPRYNYSYLWRVAYPPSLQDFVRKICRGDFELFGYDIEETPDFGLRMFL